MEGMQARMDREIQECTFQPNVGRSIRTFTWAQDVAASQDAPRGFYQTRQRLLSAGDELRQKRQQENDRMATPSPTQPMQPESVRVRVQSSYMADTLELDSPLPTVAEEVSSKRKAAMRWDSVRSSSARNKTSAPRAASAEPLTRKPASVRKGTFFGLYPRQRSTSPTQRRQEKVPLREKTSAPAAASTVASSVTNSEGVPGTSAIGPTAEAEHAVSDAGVNPAAKPPLLFVDVNIAPGRPPERIVLQRASLLAMLRQTLLQSMC